MTSQWHNAESIADWEAVFRNGTTFATGRLEEIFPLGACCLNSIVLGEIMAVDLDED